MKIIFYLLVFGLSLLLGQVPYNQEFQVNTTIDSDQLLPDVYNLSEGGFVVCWYSWHDGGGIYGQVFNSDGSKHGSEFKINTNDATGGYLNSTITGLVDGGGVVCWDNPFKDLGEVYGQIFNSDGSKRGTEFHVNTYTEEAQEKPTVSSLTDSGFVVCWESFQQDGSVDGIFGQIFKIDGSKRGSEFQVNTYSTSKQTNPNVRSLINGGFVVSWDSWNQDGSQEGIYGQVFNNDGTKLRSEFQVNTFTYDQQIQPRISSLLDGGFVICWQSLYQDGSVWGVYGQVFNSDGSKRGSEFQANSYTNIEQNYPVICSLEYGFLVCWSSNGQDGSKEGIFGQAFNIDGTKHGLEFQVNDYTNSQQTLPKISSLEDGGFVVCWESWEQDGSSYGVFAKYYTKEIVHPLRSYSLIEPGYDETIETPELPFSWQKASDIRVNLPYELEYSIYLDGDENFANPRIISQIYDTTYTIDSLVPGTTYFWKVLAKNIAGDSLWSTETNGFFVDWNATAIDKDIVNQPREFKLHQNHPNPFNPETIINYELRIKNFVKLIIYDINGRKVETLVDNQQPAGRYSVIFKWG